jgi:hypothetical protein
MRTLTLVVAIATILLSCQKEVSNKSLNASTQNQSVQHTIIFLPYDSQDEGDWWDPCTNEHVHVTGGITVEFNNVVVGNKINAQITFHYTSLSGTGDISGMKYQGMGEAHTNSQAVWNAEGGYYQVKNSNTTQRITLQAPGGGNNLVFIHNFKVVADANGNLKIFTEKFVYDTCQ